MLIKNENPNIYAAPAVKGLIEILYESLAVLPPALLLYLLLTLLYINKLRCHLCYCIAII